ncbi:MAG: universal stress protein [SAR324 cluster bacterium]|nr:universal stress protein [SAR324 cluster bacterium]
MIQLKKILVPTDGSGTSKAAMQYAMELAKSFKASITIVMVADDRYLDWMGPAYFSSSMLDEIESNTLEQAKKSLQEFWPDSADSTVEIKTLVIKGNPVEEIIEFVGREQMDMIVMGTHGRTGVSHMMIGSVAEKVVRLSPCPVLTVKSH